MALRDMLTDKMNVEAPAPVVKDRSAAPTQSFESVTTKVPAQITPLSAGQRVQAAMAGMSISHKVLTLYSGVQQGYRLKDVESGVYLRVLGVQRIPQRGSIEKHFLIDCEQVIDGT